MAGAGIDKNGVCDAREFSSHALWKDEFPGEKAMEVASPEYRESWICRALSIGLHYVDLRTLEAYFPSEENQDQYDSEQMIRVEQSFMQVADGSVLFMIFATEPTDNDSYQASQDARLDDLKVRLVDADSGQSRTEWMPFVRHDGVVYRDIPGEEPFTMDLERGAVARGLDHGRYRVEFTRTSDKD